MKHIPKREIGDHVRVMDTDTAREQRIANIRGIVKGTDKGYIIKDDKTGKLHLVNGNLLAGI